MFKDKYNDIVIISSIDWNTQRQVIHELNKPHQAFVSQFNSLPAYNWAFPEIWSK